MDITTKKFVAALIPILCLLFISAKSFAQFTIYNTSNSGLPNNFVHVSEMDSNNNLWIGTDGGLAKFDGTNWLVYNTSNSNLPADWVKSIEIVDTNEIWIGTIGLTPGLCLFNGDSIVQFDTINGSATPTVIYALKKDQNGNLWIGGEYDTFMFDGVNLVNIGANGPHYANSFSIKNGILWAGCYGYGLYKYDGSAWTNYNMSNSAIPSNFVEKVAIDSSNNIWMGGFGSSPDVKGLTKFDGTNWTNYNTTNSGIPRDPIFDLVIDAQDNIWMANGDGNYPGGLAKFDGITFTLTNTSNSNIPTNLIHDLTIDNFNRLVLSTYAYGICFYQLPATTAINMHSENNFLKIYPNPVSSHTTITSPKIFQNATLTVHDSFGKTVKQIKNISGHTITLQRYNLPNGIYFVRLTENGKAIAQDKIELID